MVALIADGGRMSEKRKCRQFTAEQKVEIVLADLPTVLRTSWSQPGER